MLVVNEEMIVVSVKKLAPCCTQTKVSLDGVSYKRLEYSPSCIQWMCNSEFVNKSKEMILEKIYKEGIK